MPSAAIIAHLLNGWGVKPTPGVATGTVFGGELELTARTLRARGAVTGSAKTGGSSAGRAAGGLTPRRPAPTAAAAASSGGVRSNRADGGSRT